MTETIPTKFPKNDVRNIDFLIQRGMFLSRSDLIRKATREKIEECYKQKSDFDSMVKEMKEKGDFNALEGKVLTRLFLESMPLKEADFNKAEQKVIRKLLRYPFKILSRKKSLLLLTEDGQSVARGYLKGLAHAKLVF